VLALDVTGSHLYVTDIGNTAIRRLTITGTTVTTLTVLAADAAPLPLADP
jgi:VCBS repeat-containing protein